MREIWILFFVGLSIFNCACDDGKSDKKAINLVDTKDYHLKEKEVISNLIDKYYFSRFAPPIPLDTNRFDNSRNDVIRIFLYDSLISPTYFLDPWEVRIPEDLNDAEIKNMVRRLADPFIFRSFKVDISKIETQNGQIRVRRYEDDRPYLMFSRVSFNDKFQKAVLYVNFACLGCSFSELLFLEKINQVWVINERRIITME